MTDTNPYIDIVQLPPRANRKTAEWNVINKRSGASLGRIAWWGPWRQYVFLVAPNTLFNGGCLATIKTFLDERMAERKR